MNESAQERLVAAISALLAKGLAQDAAVAHFIRSTHGELPPHRLATLLADGDDPQGASLAELLLFPGEDTARALEPDLARAGLDAAGSAALAQRLAAAVTAAVAILPDGTRLTVPMDAEAVARFVSRLGPERGLPRETTHLLTERLGPEVALTVAVAARRSGPAVWPPGAAALVRAVAGRLPAEAPDALATLLYLVGFLGGLAAGALPLPTLMARHGRLSAQLRRARQQELAFSKSNFETIAMTGARLPYLHAPDIARELALCAAAIEAATGRAAPPAEATCLDLGVAADAAALFAVLDDQSD
ncbi:MAG: hypothetical protein ACP59X_08755 [Solidesulfovibrio sp. DCME]|uniref:hypothetical protein n=1 Tax=Solidesulfovibrio sp. DCME TaxID=3447380 RepID=UPI003D11DC34